MNEHSGYIIAAYGFTAVTLLALIAWSFLQHRRQKAALVKLEARLARQDEQP
ncbi:heme exporter protein CcmD [Terrihabitans sp. B22-R8]|uniref:heme exporter protein CcmD n=1 Tax=Terrihabitans sp. B22-R8 TaxID=3425128 RepID=UPI00403C2DFF